MKVYHYLSTRTPDVVGDMVKDRVYEISDTFGVFVADHDKCSALILSLIHILTTHKNLSVKIDYISIVFDTATAEDVIMHILGLPTDIFNVYPASVKFKTYQARWQIGDIYVSGDEMCIRDRSRKYRVWSRLSKRTERVIL